MGGLLSLGKLDYARTLLFLNFLFIYLFLATLGLHCCMGFSPVAVSQGYSLAVVPRLLIAVASLVAEHRHLSFRS